MASFCLGYSLFCVLVLVFSQEITNGQACSLVDYGVMDLRLRICRGGHPSLSSYYQESSHRAISGQQLMNILDGYCGDVEEINNCMRREFTSNQCDDSQFQVYLQKAAVSNLVCENGRASSTLRDIYQQIPSVGLYSDNNPCNTPVATSSRQCKNQALADLNVSGEVVGIEGFVRSLVETLPCALSGIVSSSCNSMEAFLSTTIHYGRVVIPPQLGVNVAEILTDMAHNQLT